MIGRIHWEPRTRTLSTPNHGPLKGPRIGCMIHFDASGSDAGSLAWFTNPKCKVSYNDLILDDGSHVVIAPRDRRAWHAGICRPSSARLQYTDANSAFYGVAIASNEKIEATALQMISVAWRVRHLFEYQGWPLTDTWRITGHEDEAWHRGRKSDPSGPSKLNPILSVENVRRLLPLFD